MVSQAELHELKPEELHKFWPLLRRGVNDIKRKCKPNWVPEDIYSAIRTAQVNCVISLRGERFLGFVIYSKQLRIFNYLPELFVWLAWNLPVREWLADDDMPAAVTQVWQYIANVARTQYQTDQITWITPPGRARAFSRRFGWRAAWVTMTAKV